MQSSRNTHDGLFLKTGTYFRVSDCQRLLIDCALDYFQDGFAVIFSARAMLHQ